MNEIPLRSVIISWSFFQYGTQQDSHHSFPQDRENRGRQKGRTFPSCNGKSDKSGHDCLDWQDMKHGKDKTDLHGRALTDRISFAKRGKDREHIEHMSYHAVQCASSAPTRNAFAFRHLSRYGRSFADVPLRSQANGAPRADFPHQCMSTSLDFRRHKFRYRWRHNLAFTS